MFVVSSEGKRAHSRTRTRASSLSLYLLASRVEPYVSKILIGEVFKRARICFKWLLASNK